MSDQSEQPRELQEVRIPIRYNVPPNTPGGYATEFVIQRTEHEYHLYFFQLNIPVALGTPEQQRELIENSGSISADCISHIIVAADKMPDFLKAMQTNVTKYVKPDKPESEAKETNGD